MIDHVVHCGSNKEKRPSQVHTQKENCHFHDELYTGAHLPPDHVGLGICCKDHPLEPWTIYDRERLVCHYDPPKGALPKARRRSHVAVDAVRRFRRLRLPPVLAGFMLVPQLPVPFVHVRY